MTRLIRVLTALAAVVAAVLALAAPVHASQVTRTFNAYDLTQCDCLYSPGATISYVNGWPKVIVTSYYDSHVDSTDPYTRPSDINRYRAYNGRGTRDGLPVETNSGALAYVLCWTTDIGGTQVDKVTTYLTVDDVSAWFIIDIPDRYVWDGIRYSDHHC